MCVLHGVCFSTDIVLRVNVCCSYFGHERFRLHVCARNPSTLCVLIGIPKNMNALYYNINAVCWSSKRLWLEFDANTN